MALERPKYIKKGDEGRRALMAGFGRAARLAGVTLGPNGACVALERAHDYPEFTKDGFTAIRDLEERDRFATLGAELLKAAADKTRKAAGDGSTTTALLAGALAHAGARLVTAGLDPMTVRRAFDGLAREARASLASQSEPAGDRAMLETVALTACAADLDLARIVAEAVHRLGPEGVATVSYHQSVDTEVDYMSGMTFDHGLLSRNFLLKAGETEVKLDRPYLLLCQGDLTEARQLVPALEAARRDGRSLLVLARDVSDQALAVMLANHREGTVRSSAVKGPGSGIYRHAETDDIAMLTGGVLLGEELGLLPEKLKEGQLGAAKRAVAGGAETTIFGGSGGEPAVAARVAQLRDALAAETRSYDRGKYETRIARLVSGVANIRVGGLTEAAWKERYKRCENALNAARAAAAEGVLPGGGVGLARASFALEEAQDMERGSPREAFARVLQEPFRRIAASAGREPSLALVALRDAEGHKGFDGRTGDFVDYREAGIVDAARAVATALTNATATAGQLVSTGCVVALARRPDAV